MKNYLKDELGILHYLPIDLKENKFIIVTNKGVVYPNKYTIQIVKFDTDIYRNMYPKLVYQSTEISFSGKSDSINTANYIQRKKLF
jgi:hypothetical protein